MKNISFFCPAKYSTPEYHEVAPNVYSYNDHFVTSLSFEQEPAWGEGQSAADISQYPLEDVLERYYVHVSDFYPELNHKASATCYLEFAANKVKRIEDLLGIIGKRVINKDIYENGEVSTILIIE